MQLGQAAQPHHLQATDASSSPPCALSVPARQVEGAWNEDGRAPSVWDTFAHQPGACIPLSDCRACSALCTLSLTGGACAQAEPTQRNETTRLMDCCRLERLLLPAAGVDVAVFCCSWAPRTPQPAAGTAHTAREQNKHTCTCWPSAAGALLPPVVAHARVPDPPRQHQG